MKVKDAIPPSRSISEKEYNSAIWFTSPAKCEAFRKEFEENSERLRIYLQQGDFRFFRNHCIVASKGKDIVPKLAEFLKDSGTL